MMMMMKMKEKESKELFSVCFLRQRVLQNLEAHAYILVALDWILVAPTTKLRGHFWVATTTKLRGNFWVATTTKLRGNFWVATTTKLRGNFWVATTTKLRGNFWVATMTKLRGNFDECNKTTHLPNTFNLTVLESNDEPSVATHLYTPLSAGKALVKESLAPTIFILSFCTIGWSLSLQPIHADTTLFQTTGTGGTAVDAQVNEVDSPSLISSWPGVTTTSPGTKDKNTNYSAKYISSII